MRVSFTVRDSEPRHLVVEADPRTPAAEIAGVVAETTGDFGHAYYLGPDAVTGTRPIGEIGLREGAFLDRRPHARAAEPPVLIELHVVSGPGAGVIVPLAMGSYSIGSAPECTVLIGDAPEVAATLTVGPEGDVSVLVHEPEEVRLVQVVPPSPLPQEGGQAAESDEQAWLAAAPPGGAAAEPWPASADLEVRDVLVHWTAPVPRDAAVRSADDGTGLDFNRPPRIVEPLPRTRFRIPAPPPVVPRRPFPLAMMFAPALLGVAMVFLLHSMFFLIFAVFSPVFAISNWVSDRRHNRKDHKRRVAERAATKARLAVEIADAVAAERLVRAAIAPDPALLAATVTGPGRRLWERRRRDPDHLVLRLGTVDQPSVVEVEDEERVDPLRPGTRADVPWTVPAIPTGVALTDCGVVGFAGPAERIRPLVAWLVAQAAVLHSPRDVRLVVLTDADGAQTWDWVRWLPHARSPFGDPPVLIGNDPETVAHRVAELVSIVKQRTKARGSAMGSVMFADPDIVVVVDGARRLRDVAGLVQVLAEGPAVRVYALCVDSEVRLLPEEAATIVVDGPAGLALRQNDQPELSPIRPDLPPPEWFDRVARALAPVRDTTPEDGGSLPLTVRLLDLLDLPEPDGEQVAARWLLRPASTAAVIGTGFDGPTAIDLVRDGPHTLIAGTTGSGKSEFLQTLVASLALANRPDELTFLLIDYKGGSAFRDCVDLPHTLGMVTDLDGHLVDRALESLAAELRRRERLLAEHGHKDYPAYQAARRREPDLPPLPRLVLVIDEFATLVREVPAFIPGMVSLAQRGRSLGIHLVLATQRPAGVVTPDIRANTNLRIALRVTDPVESADIIDTADAAMIPATVPGRALVRLAHRSVAPFQTGYVGGEHTDADAEVPISPPWAVAVPWSRLGRVLEPPEQAGQAVGPEVPTDLSVLVAALADAAGQLEIPRQPSPWLPALPSRLTLAELPSVSGQDHELAPVAYGLQDIPSLQTQRAITIDPDTFGHLYVVGATRSGRSQTLRTIAAALAGRHSAGNVHFYGIDAGGGALSVLAHLPHTGAVAHRADIERVDRLLTRLGQELSRRQDLLAEHHSANLTELRAAMPPGPRPAHAFVLVDGWEALYAAVGEYDNGRLIDECIRLLREGAAAGIHVILSGDRALLSGRIGSLNDNRLLLRLTDRSDYIAVGLPMDRLPTVVEPGRAWISGSSTEVQVAVVAADPSGAAQAAAIRALGEKTTQRDEAVGKDSRPLPIGLLPAELSFNDAFDRVAERRPMLGVLGVGGDVAEPVLVDFAGKASVFTVCGPPGTGRSTVLVTLAVSLLAGGTNVVAVTPRASPLRRLDAHPQVRVLTEANPSGAELEAAVKELGSPCVVLVDDADLLAQMPAADLALRAIVATGRDRGVGLAMAGSSETFVQAMVGWVGEARRMRQGVLLNPQTPAEGDLVGARIPPNQLRRPPRAGRGYVADPVSGGIQQIALPLTVLKTA
ncbi:cell division protein FtsK [Catenulispora sp. NL8]|uniref:Cell division protein FtsK n=1 Tax=Catenulispora pinistramenti TaxID=2705254 RepID=A0ABS5L584_9ACTN|nr:FtsK/SpoIIIE domain-containing protein [Catenulispora pinistramenti]MBS2553505.1 cell division protein FtsK [Catenulispora pinistramenti]